MLTTFSLQQSIMNVCVLLLDTQLIKETTLKMTLCNTRVALIHKSDYSFVCMETIKMLKS